MFNVLTIVVLDETKEERISLLNMVYIRFRRILVTTLNLFAWLKISTEVSLFTQFHKIVYISLRDRSNCIVPEVNNVNMTQSDFNLL